MAGSSWVVLRDLGVETGEAFGQMELAFGHRSSQALCSTKPCGDWRWPQSNKVFIYLEVKTYGVVVKVETSTKKEAHGVPLLFECG